MRLGRLSRLSFLHQLRRGGHARGRRACCWRPRKRLGGATPIAIEIVTGPPNQRGFIVQKRRWVVERTFAWLGRNRRLARDYERTASTALAFIVLAAAAVLMKRIGAIS